jgi:hypothetical protein
MLEITEKHEVFIATAVMEFPGSFAAKFRWLAQHFPFIPPSHIVFCGDKSILSVDYLIDDNDRHFRRFHSQGVLFTAPHNLYVTGYPRVNGWADVRRMFLDGSLKRGNAIEWRRTSASHRSSSSWLKRQSWKPISTSCPVWRRAASAARQEQDERAIAECD